MGQDKRALIGTQRYNIDLANLTLSQGFEIYGASAGDRIGGKVSKLGDINGDGISDMAFGDGMAYVIYGQNTNFLLNIDLTNLSLSQGFAIYGAGSVSNLGDINGDGIPDIFVGLNALSPLGRTEAGITYVIYGQNTSFSSNINLASLPLSQGFAIYGVNNYDWSGMAVSNLGDINGDGIPDMIIGARYADPFSRDMAGTVYVIYGQNISFGSNIDLASLSLSQGFAIYGADTYNWLGQSVNNLGDVNGDGIDDIIIGANVAAPPVNRYAAGITYVIYGQSTNFSSNIDLANLTLSQGFAIYGANVSDTSGWSVSGLGDINGDSIPDMIIGAPEADPFARSEAGIAYVIYGQNTNFLSNINLANLTLSQGFAIYGANAKDEVGASVSGSDDINGDGIPDIIIGAYHGDPAGPGAVYVIYGQSTNFSSNIDLANLTLSQGFAVYGANSTDMIGYSVSGSDDINGDGTPDVIIGSQYASPLGRVQAGIISVIYGFSPINYTICDGEQLCITKGLPVGTVGQVCVDPTNVFNPTTQQVVRINDTICDGEQLCISSSLYATCTPLLNKSIGECTKSASSSSTFKTWRILGLVGMITTGIETLAITYLLYKYCYKGSGKNMVRVASEVSQDQSILKPIGITLEEGREIKLIKLSNSDIYFNYGNGLVKTSWISSDDALLVYDHNQNNMVDSGSEIVFTTWSSNAKTDFQALLNVFDTNKDKIFDNRDIEFSKFYLWQDKNQNGRSDKGELIGLKDAGLISIDFNAQQEIVDSEDNAILGIAPINWGDGRVTDAYDLVFYGTVER